MRMWAWKDSVDPDVVSIGVRHRPCKGVPDRFTSWTQIHTDGINEIFGEDVLSHINEHGKTPVLISGQLEADGNPCRPLDED